MSDQKTSKDGVRVVPSKQVLTPSYSYQKYEGRGGFASFKRAAAPERQFAELQNFSIS